MPENFFLPKPKSTAFYDDVEPTAPSFQSKWRPHSDGTIFYIGPESGFDNDETEALQKLGAQGVKLHQNILRIDTASLVALSLISSFLME